MPRPTNAIPTYRHHRASGQAVVTLDGRVIYLGPWNSTASRREYDRVVGEWMARGRMAPADETQGIDHHHRVVGQVRALGQGVLPGRLE